MALSNQPNHPTTTTTGTMTTDFRALCVELVNELHEYKEAHPNHGTELFDRARAALAEPERPTDKELLCIAAKTIGGYSDGINPGEYEETTECVVEVYGSELCDFARAVNKEVMDKYDIIRRALESIPDEYNS